MRRTRLVSQAADPNSIVHRTWTHVDRAAILDGIRADLTASELVEIDSFDDERFARFAGCLFTEVQAHFNSGSAGARAQPHGRP
jgi:hypothetical protein